MTQVQAISRNKVITALNSPTQSHYLSVEHRSLHFRSWNHDHTDKPALLLIHGFLGHSHWWDMVAPFLTARHRVYALDLSGMGDSDRRENYLPIDHVDDLIMVAEVIANHKPVAFIGHSFGGYKALRACLLRPSLLQHAIILDTRVPIYDGPRENYPMKGNPKPYPNFDAIRSRYRLIPPQSAIIELLNHIAVHSIVQVADGWTWKFDHGLLDLPIEYDWPEILPQIQVPVDFIYGADSVIVDTKRAQDTLDLIGQGREAITVHNAGHHLMLDQPEQTIAALQKLLGDKM